LELSILTEIHNLHRQILYTEDQVGLPKATTAKALVEKLNPLIKVMAFEEKLTTENAIVSFHTLTS
jgi:adenylyltransferase/sulfurtransferase